jgi:hypothetical protein
MRQLKDLRNLLGTGVFLLILSSCKSINPVAPIQETKAIPVVEQPVSTIVLPLEISLSSYYALADKEVPKKFNGGEHPCAGVSFDYHFDRDPLKLNADNNNITIDVSGKYWIKMSYCVECTDLITEKPVCISPRIPFSCGVGEPMRKMSLQYTSNFELTKDYGIKTTTTLTKLEAIDPCKVTVFHFDATDQLLTEVKKSLTTLAKDIDKQTSAINFKSQAKAAWKQASETFYIPSYGYVHLNPLTIGLVEPRVSNNMLYSTLIIEARPLFNHNPTSVTPKPLPDLNIVKKPVNDTFQLFVDFNLNYDSLSKTIQQLAGGQKLMLQKKEIIFDSVSIAGASNNELLFKVKFSGSKKGILYLRGIPTFNPETETIELTNLDFDLETKSVLLKTAKWLFSNRILEEIRKISKQDLKYQMKTLTKALNESLHYTYQDYYLNGSINDLHVTHLYPDTSQLVVRVKAKGKMKLTNRVPIKNG